MKRNWKKIATTACVVLLCMSVKAQTITRYIEYTVPIEADSSSDRDYVNRIPDRSREVWLQNLLDKVKEGDIPAYAADDRNMEEPLSIDEVRYILVDIDTMIDPINMWGDFYVYEGEVGANDIISITFREQWVWTEDGSFRKEVLGMCFIRELYTAYGELIGNETLFCIENEDASTKLE